VAFIWQVDLKDACNWLMNSLRVLKGINSFW